MSQALGPYRRPPRSLAIPGRTANISHRIASYAGRQLAGAAKRWWKNAAKRKREEKKATYPTELPILNEGVGGQYTECVYRGPTSYGVDRTSVSLYAPQVEVANIAGQLLVTPGVQNAAAPMQMCSSADFNLIAGTSKIQRYVLERAIGEIFMANNYKANVRITIYDVVARRDIPSATLTSAFTTWSQGLTDIGLTNTYQNVGATPYGSDAFNFYWKVLNRTEVVLAGGSVHRHRVVWKGGKLVAGPEAAYLSGWKDCTYNTLVVISGQPAHDSTTKTSVTLGSGGIDYTIQTEHRWKLLSSNLPVINRSNALATSFAAGEAEAFVGGTTTGTNAQA